MQTTINAVAREPEEKVTITAKLMNHLIEQNYQLGVQEGRDHAEVIQLGDSNYGATVSSIQAVEFKSFQALRAAIRSKRYRRNGENPGQAFMWTCELMHIHHGDYSKVAILKCATHYDI